MSDSNSTNISDFYQLEVVGRGSETQLEAVKLLIYILVLWGLTIKVLGFLPLEVVSHNLK